MSVEVEADGPAEPAAASASSPSGDRSGEVVNEPFVAETLLQGMHQDSGGAAAFGSGGFAIGTLNVGTSAREADRLFVTSPMREGDVLATSEPHVATASDPKLTARLAAQPVVYVVGPPGTGREPSAVTALAGRLGPSSVACIDLAEGRQLRDVVARPGFLLEGYGHVLRLDDEGGVRVRASDLGALVEAAERRKATVVVVGIPGRYNAECVQYLVTHEAPDPKEVFASWLATELIKRGRCVGDCPTCAGSCVATYVDRCCAVAAVQLGAVTGLGSLVGLARQVVEQGITPERLCGFIEESGFGLRSKAKVFLRASDDGDVPEADLHLESARRDQLRVVQHRRAFRIAYALLNQQPLTQVFRATGKLMDLLDETQKLRFRGRPVLRHDVATLLGDAADLVNPAAGLSRTARLRIPAMRAAVLDVVWNDYDSAREPLQRWLYWLGAEPALRQTGAVLAGLLCGYDFDQAFEQIISPWAGSERVGYRQAAAWACEAAVSLNPPVRGRVMAQLRRWARSELARFADTAAMAYGTRIGQWYSQQALVDIELIARFGPARGRSLVWAVDQLFGVAPAEILRMVVDWGSLADRLQPVEQIQPRQEVLISNANWAFVELARRPSADPTDGRPELLAMASDTQRDNQPSSELAGISGMWVGVLRYPETSSAAWEVLEDWIRCTQASPEAASAMSRLLEPVLADADLRARFRFHAGEIWPRRMPDNEYLEKLRHQLREA